MSVSILDRFFAGDKLALARIITHIENRGEDLPAILPRLYEKTGGAYRIGFTGPPGSGKSTLVDKMAENYVSDSAKVGIIAVDPSSPFTGGALLGDRIRMQNLTKFEDIFIRSMATRGSSGGLAASTGEVAMAMDAFGKDIILIETVGVGQVELDIADSCDTTVVVLVPESGDSIQALKAGLMEIANIFVVNKSDREGAESFAIELNMVLDNKRKNSEWDYPVINAQAINDIGIDELQEAISRHRKFLTADKRREKFYYRRTKNDLCRVLYLELKNFMTEHILTNEALDSYIDSIMKRETNPYEISERIIRSLNQDKL
jgi:LAO/AO transport system kinase